MSVQPVSAHAEAVVREKADRIQKIPEQRTLGTMKQRVIKRPLWCKADDVPKGKKSSPRGEIAKKAVSSIGLADSVERELLDAVAILHSLKNSSPCPCMLRDCAGARHGGESMHTRSVTLD